MFHNDEVFPDLDGLLGAAHPSALDALQPEASFVRMASGFRASSLIAASKKAAMDCVNSSTFSR